MKVKVKRKVHKILYFCQLFDIFPLDHVPKVQLFVYSYLECEVFTSAFLLGTVNLCICFSEVVYLWVVVKIHTHLLGKTRLKLEQFFTNAKQQMHFRYLKNICFLDQSFYYVVSGYIEKQIIGHILKNV